MPKKTSFILQRKWLEEYESGKPEATIASEYRNDVRTVKKGIEQARQMRRMEIARTDLLRDSLRQHHSQLVDILKELLPAIMLPPVDLEIPLSEKMPVSIRLPGGEFKREEGEKGELVLDVEKTVMFELLADHLQQDHFPIGITKWKQSLISHIEARMDLKEKAFNLIEGTTGYPIAHNSDNAPATGFIWPVTGRLFYEAILKYAILIKDGPDIPKSLVIPDSDNCIRFDPGNHLLARVPSDRQICRENLIQAYMALKKSEEMAEVSDTWRQLEPVTEKTRRLIEQTSLFGMVPGSCEVCRRMGG